MKIYYMLILCFIVGKTDSSALKLGDFARRVARLRRSVRDVGVMEPADDEDMTEGSGSFAAPPSKLTRRKSECCKLGESLAKTSFDCRRRSFSEMDIRRKLILIQTLTSEAADFMNPRAHTKFKRNFRSCALRENVEMEKCCNASAQNTRSSANINTREYRKRHNHRSRHSNTRGRHNNRFKTRDDENNYKWENWALYRDFRSSKDDGRRRTK